MDEPAHKIWQYLIVGGGGGGGLCQELINMGKVRGIGGGKGSIEGIDAPNKVNYQSHKIWANWNIVIKIDRKNSNNLHFCPMEKYFPEFAS